MAGPWPCCSTRSVAKGSLQQPGRLSSAWPSTPRAWTSARPSNAPCTRPAGPWHVGAAAGGQGALGIEPSG
eukprot:7747927-Lingulodinium_polyedra.AAC.1